ncbi:MAG: hydrogenase expression/formation protein HypE [candidate division WOR-3 bacterium]|nr:hydrogenase expression/formation protein HypE [candidate division WOR-3 bacterium]
MKKILLSHGGGGKAMASLIKELIAKKFSNKILNELTDSAILSSTGDNRLCFTTDSYVVNPLFFPGGDIGKLAVNGTVNDLSVMGAKPLYLSCSFIIEEGFDWETLDKVTASMAEAARKAGIKIVTGDTKVVGRGSADQLFINTAGIGILNEGINISTSNIQIGDKIIINGPIGEHGLAVMSEREGFETDIRSDCAPLWDLVSEVLPEGGIKFMRDPTRGGLSSVLCEITERRDYGIKILEEDIPIHDNVSGFCEILGFDPLVVANEGKVLVVVSPETASSVLKRMKKHPLGREASIIGEITKENEGLVVLETVIGGLRILDRLVGDQLPRIC